MKDKETKILNRSRRHSYGKKASRRHLTGRKQRAIEPARIREVKAITPVQEAKPIEKVTPTEKIPWRAPRSKPAPGTYACRTVTGGVAVVFLLLASFISFAGGMPWVSLYFFIPGLLGLILTLKDFSKSRGGW